MRARGLLLRHMPLPTLLSKSWSGRVFLEAVAHACMKDWAFEEGRYDRKREPRDELDGKEIVGVAVGVGV